MSRKIRGAKWKTFFPGGEIEISGERRRYRFARFRDTVGQEKPDALGNAIQSVFAFSADAWQTRCVVGRLALTPASRRFAAAYRRDFRFLVLNPVNHVCPQRTARVR